VNDISYDAKPAWRAYTLSILLGIATLLFTIGVLIILWAILDRYGKRYTVDAQKVEARKGIVSRHSESIQLDNLHEAELKQSVIQKILGVGDLCFSTAESTDAEVIFQDIPKPAALKELIEQFLAER
jgi:uncharacterized membrane protein YdbT with pleckstrin-like domain